MDISIKSKFSIGDMIWVVIASDHIFAKALPRQSKGQFCNLYCLSIDSIRCILENDKKPVIEYKFKDITTNGGAHWYDEKYIDNPMGTINIYFFSHEKAAISFFEKYEFKTQSVFTSNKTINAYEDCNRYKV